MPKDPPPAAKPNPRIIPDDEKRPVFAPPDTLSDDEKRVDSKTGKPWHEASRNRDLLEEIQLGKVYPMSLTDYKAKQAQPEPEQPSTQS